MKLLVTGANGLVGQRVARQAAARGHQVLALGRGPRRVDLPGEYQDVDLTDGPRLHQLLAAERPEAVVNPASMTDVDGCERAPVEAVAANVTGPALLAAAARQASAFLVHVSTDYVFDGEAGPYEVDALPNPRGVYALSKHAGEQVVKASLPSGQWAVARTAVVYGWPQAAKGNFGSWLVSSFRAGTKVKLFADQWVSPSWAGSVAAMLVELAERRLAGTFHTAGAEVVDRVTFGRALANRFGFDEGLVTPSSMAEVKLLSPRPAKAGLSTGGTARVLRTQPLTLAQSLDAFHAEVHAS